MQPAKTRRGGFHTVPVANVALDGNYLAMYAFGVVSVGLGEAISVYALGWPLAQHIFRTRAFSFSE